ncbi:MAG: hypothetical protein ACLUHE_15580 [Christensenellales bacterium]
MLEGTLRAFDDNVHARLIEHFKRIITDVSAAYGCTAEIDINEVTGVVVNDEALCQIARETAAELVPPEKIQKQEPCMLGDDFAAYRAIAPAALCRSACSRRKRIAATPITTACSKWMRMCCRCASRGWPPMPSAPQEADFSTALWKKRPVFPV